MHFNKSFIRNILLCIATVIAIIILALVIFKDANPVVINEDFERNTLNLRCSGNCPTLSSEYSYSGSKSLKSFLDYNASDSKYRTEISLSHKALIGQEYRYSFKILLPSNYAKDNIWEIVAQWHAVPDFELGENWRNPVMALWTTNGQWKVSNIWDSKENTFETGKREYDGQTEWPLSAYETEKWVYWRFQIKWSYESDGVIKIWKDNELVVNKTGPNCFNDQLGPYFKLGIYKGWKNQKANSNNTKRTVYYDDLVITQKNNSTL